MAFKDYQDLDLKPEKATREEIEQLSKNMEYQSFMIQVIVHIISKEDEQNRM